MNLLIKSKVTLHKEFDKIIPALVGSFYLCYNQGMEKKRLVVLMGGQGVGKGSVAKGLVESHGFIHVETGAILREMPPESEVCKIITSGNLVPDNLLFDIMVTKINPEQNIVLDGFPRKLSQAQWLVENYKNTFDIHVLYLYADKDLMIKRIIKRANEENRTDDKSMDVINRRLDNFYTMTMPAIEWLRGVQGVKFSEIDASGNKEQNLQDTFQALHIQV